MAPAPGRKRVTADVPEEVYAALTQARIEDGGGVSTRTRALLQMWFEDPDLREDVARWLRAERAAQPPRVCPPEQ